MTPKDWDKIGRMLESIADKETVDAVKALVENMKTSLQGSLTANVVKSVQRGIITIASSSSSGTTTINAVDVNKAVIIPNGVWISDAPGGDPSQRMIEQGKGYFALTNSTTVTLTEGYHGASYTVKGAFTVVEYY